VPIHADGLRAERPIISELSPHAASAEALLVAFRDEMRELYAGVEMKGSAEPVVPDGLEPLYGRFLGLRVSDELVGCGGVRVLTQGVAEIKRMYVVKRSRRRGYGRLLLEALEHAALTLECSRVRLDTGLRQDAARSLYLSMGYKAIPPSNDMPSGTFWAEKVLVPAAA
jgi:GNAT superfamily N-acetyltransferase